MTPFAAVDSVKGCVVLLKPIADRQMRETIGREKGWAEKISLTRQGWGVLDRQAVDISYAEPTR